MQRFRLLLAAFSLLPASAVPAADALSPARLVITGSSTMAPLAAEIAHRFQSLPLVRPLMPVAAGTAKDFIDFCLSSRVTDLVRALDFVPYLD